MEEIENALNDVEAYRATCGWTRMEEVAIAHVKKIKGRREHGVSFVTDYAIDTFWFIEKNTAIVFATTLSLRYNAKLTNKLSP